MLHAKRFFTCFPNAAGSIPYASSPRTFVACLPLFVLVDTGGSTSLSFRLHSNETHRAKKSLLPVASSLHW